MRMLGAFVSSARVWFSGGVWHSEKLRRCLCCGTVHFNRGSSWCRTCQADFLTADAKFARSQDM